MSTTDIKKIYSLAFGKDLARGKDISPDKWQLQFATDAWPKVLIAPTGSGKTAGVTLGWAAHRMRAPAKTPRRLVWCLPMRTLVEQTSEVVKKWFDRLHSDMDVSEEMLPKPEDVHILMGGVEASDWLAKPERPAVLVGTQDMLLSRALMRGYATSRAKWPMEFALLHDDAQWVFDEVQLMGAGRATSTQLEAFRQCEAERAAKVNRANGLPARSLWVSATLEPAWLKTVDHATPPPEAVLRVAPSTETDGRLARLAKAKKTLRRTDIAPASQKADDIKRYVAELADAILNAHRPEHMTLVIVNRVARAQALHEMLKKSLSESDRSIPALVLIHSRFRRVDRDREMKKMVSGDTRDIIVIATQAVEAGVDISAAVMFTELAPWASMVQRFGRANRYAEFNDGADIRWIDLLDEAHDDKAKIELARPYEVEKLQAARGRLASLFDAAPANLPPSDDIDPPRRVIRRKDLDDLFDTDPDLTGFDVDVSPYVRDAEDTDITVFWRDLSENIGESLQPHADELCRVPISQAKEWLKKVHKKNPHSIFVRDPQWRSNAAQVDHILPGWKSFRDNPRPGMTLLVDKQAGGYNEHIGFTGDSKHVPIPIDSSIGSGTNPASASSPDEEGHDEDPRSTAGSPVLLRDHLDHVAAEAESLCNALAVDSQSRAVIVRAARWHDLGKAHEVFQDTMRRGLVQTDAAGNGLLAKTEKKNLRHCRPYFRHELASALALLNHEHWSRDADLAAYLIAAHHGKVRMNLRALPRERAPQDEQAGARFARGVWEGDKLPPFDLGTDEYWPGRSLTLSIMELGWDEVTRESWTERTRDLLARFGPFRLAWMETVLRLADWRASAKEEEGGYDNA